MQIRCLRCKQEFDISKEQLKKIEEIRIGKMTPKDYLKFFPLIAGECKTDKNHDFVFTDTFLDQKKQLTQKYVDKQTEMVTLQTNVKLNEDKEKELLTEKEKLTTRIDQIRDEMRIVQSDWTELTSMLIPNSILESKEMLDKFEDLTGTTNIELWKDETVPQKEGT